MYNAGILKINICIRNSVQHATIGTQDELDKLFLCANVFFSPFIKILYIFPLTNNPRKNLIRKQIFNPMQSQNWQTKYQK